MKGWSLVVGCWLFGNVVDAQEVLVPLHEGWSFRQVGKQQWYPAEVPGTVHTDLLRQGLIPDPMRNGNIDSVQWIENEDWVYGRTITVADTLFKHANIDLVFRGLDTFAEVYLNDSLLGKAHNMFRAWYWPIKHLLKRGDNELKVIFRSTIKEGAKLRDAYGVQLPHDNDPSGVSPYVRKAAYQFGWDFAPRLVGCGIWQPVELRCWDAVTRTEMVEVYKSGVTFEKSRDHIGVGFRFLKNAEPLFIRGCNLIPPASLLSGANNALWLRLVRSMQAARMNMVRVWAGGVYPPKEFFHACDTAGILVWQDFMHANIGPADDVFVSSSLREAEEKVREFEDQPAIAIWCGNNELDVAWKNWGWQERYKLEKGDQRTISEFNAMFFGRELADVVDRLSSRSYTPTSPLSNWGNAQGLQNGDLHYWGVWHGDSAFSSFANNVGRFVSEYGFQSYPDSVTLAHYIDPEHLYLGSPMLAKRQKSYKTDKPIWTAIERELGETPTTLGRFIDCSQVVQAEAYRQAIWAHRTNQPHCMGTLYWQLNDVWAAPTWSTIDVDLRWKAAHYEVKRSYTERVLAFLPKADGTTSLELWTDNDATGDTVFVEFWSVQGELVRREVKQLTGKGRLVVGSWPEAAWEAGMMAYAFGASAEPRMYSTVNSSKSGQRNDGLSIALVPGHTDVWEVRTTAPIRTVKVVVGPDDHPSDNWFPLVPGHSVRVQLERGARSTSQPPGAYVFRR